jgi:hypothetical protein
LILIFEPLCKGISHERINCGFIAGAKAAFPEERIIFYGETSQIYALQRVFALEKYDTSGIEYMAVSIEPNDGLISIIRNIKILRIIFNFAIKNGSTRILFTAVSSPVLVAAKYLKQLKKYQALKLMYVMHDILESIGNIKGGFMAGQGIEIPKLELDTGLKRKGAINYYCAKFDELGMLGFLLRIQSLLIANLKKAALLAFRFIYKKSILKDIISRIFSFSTLLKKLNSEWYELIVLSPHIKINLDHYIDATHLKIAVVTMPFMFSRKSFDQIPTERQIDSTETNVRFGAIGNGHPGRLRELAERLIQIEPRGKYEIAAFTMNNAGFDRFSNIRHFGIGRRVSREIIDAEVSSIDYFLYLYDETQYNLSCSGSFFEVFSYIMPIIAFPCKCIDYFNTPELPIGYRCKGIEEMSNLMKKMVEAPNVFAAQREIFRTNITHLRNELNCVSNTLQMRNAFSF